MQSYVSLCSIKFLITFFSHLSGMYVASTKPGGFQLEVTNNDSTLVICGLRIAVGAMDTQKVPAYLEVRPDTIIS